jgi:ssDNA-binding Zn-finger/Zn-ribbon topoisomerase 1
MSRFRVYRSPAVHVPPANGHVRNDQKRRGEALELGIAICPRCGGPMTARQGRTGPYFHCLCFEATGRT